MKKTILMLLTTLCILCLAGCGLFSSETTDNASTGDIKLNDTYTYQDPDIDFANRFAFTSGESQEIAESYKANYNVDCVAEYVFIYGDKEDRAVAQLDYWVFKTEEDAARFIEQISEFGNGTMQQEGCVVWDNYDAAGVADLITMQRQYSGLADDTCSGYAQFIKDCYGYMNVQ